MATTTLREAEAKVVSAEDLAALPLQARRAMERAEMAFDAAKKGITEAMSCYGVQPTPTTCSHCGASIRCCKNAKEKL